MHAQEYEIAVKTLASAADLANQIAADFARLKMIIYTAAFSSLPPGVAEELHTALRETSAVGEAFGSCRS